MASHTEKQRILSGSLNLLPPSDKIPDGDSLILDNWRVDQQGCLRTRNGSVLEAGPVGSGWFHTLGRTDTWRYAGIGSHLYWGPTLGSDIASGFDGAPLGLAFYQSSAWVMNRAKRLRVKAAEVQNWGIAGPTAAATATAGAVSTITLNPYNVSTDLSYGGYFDSSRAWVDKISTLAFNTNPTLNSGFGNVPLVANSSVSFPWLFITSLVPGHDTSFSGKVSDDDTFTLKFYADNPAVIDSVVITLFSNQNTLGGSAPSVQVKIDGATLGATGRYGRRGINQAAQTWTTINIKRGVSFDFSSVPTIANPDGSFSPDPDALAHSVSETMARLNQPHFMEYQGAEEYSGFGTSWAGTMGPVYPTYSAGGYRLPSPFNWANVTGIEIQVNLTNPCIFGLGALSVTGVVPGTLTGNLTYYVSYFNADGEDSNPSGDSDGNLLGAAVSVNNQAVSLSAIPVSSDAQVTGRYIYRIGGGLNQPLRIGTIFDNTTTTYTDQTSNQLAQNMGLVMNVNRTLPPACSGVVGPYLGRLIAFGSAADPARYWWTEAAQPWYFPGADDLAGNWEDAGNSDDPLIAITYHKTMLIMYKQRSIWRLAGDPGQANPVQTNANVGLVGPRAVVSGGMVDYFVGPEGVYRFNIDFEQKISEQLDPIFKSDYVYLSTGRFLPPIDKANIGNSVLELVNDRLRFSYPEVGQTYPNVVAVYHLTTGKWAREFYNIPGAAPTAMHYEGSGLFLMGGFTGPAGGYLIRMETPTNWSDAGYGIHCEWQSRTSDQGLPDNHKYYSDLVIDYQTAAGDESPSTLVVYLVYDNGASVLRVGTLSSQTRTTIPLQLISGDPVGSNNFGIKAKNCAVRIVGDVTSACIIHGVYLHWYPVERYAKSFDSGFIGSERVRQVDYLEMVMTGTGQAASYILSSDQPGSALVQRLFRGLTVPNGRGAVRFRLPSIVEGRNLRLTLGADTAFELHQSRMRQREIGEYVDGTIGEYWESPEFNLAPGRDGEIKDLLLDYDSSDSGAQVVLYSDALVSGSLAAQRTVAMPVRGTRGQYVFAFEDYNGNLPAGSVFKLRVYPGAGIVRLHGRAVLRARVFGVSFNGANGESWTSPPLDLVDGIGEYRDVVGIAQTGGPMTFEFSTELPGSDVRSRATYTFNSATTSTGRVPFQFRLPGSTRGRLSRFRVSGSNWCRLFHVEVYARRVGGAATPWAYVPMLAAPGSEGTNEDWQQIQVPIHQTPAEFSWIDIPVDPAE